MRFLVRFVPSKEFARIDLDYRRGFISFLKAIFGDAVFSQSSARPYTFAVFFGKEAKIKGKAIDNVKFVNFRFSTGDNYLGIEFYNGVLRLKSNSYKLPFGNSSFSIERVFEEKELLNGNTFKTLSPVVVERMGFSNPKDIESRYLVPGEDMFVPSLLSNIMLRYDTIKGKPLKVGAFSFEPLGTKKEYVAHYGGYIKAFIGRFKINTNSYELLDFIYKYGLGLRTGQGFGYLEVEDEKA